MIIIFKLWIKISLIKLNLEDKSVDISGVSANQYELKVGMTCDGYSGAIKTILEQCLDLTDVPEIDWEFQKVVAIRLDLVFLLQKWVSESMHLLTLSQILQERLSSLSGGPEEQVQWDERKQKLKL